MAWSADIWSQDDAKFGGYPFVDATGLAIKFNGFDTVWKLETDVFFGYPYIYATGLAKQYQVGGFSKLYLGKIKLPKLYHGGASVKRVYRGREIVFEKG